MNTFVHLWQCSAELFLELEMSQKRKLQRISNHVLCSIPLHENHAACEVMWKIMQSQVSYR